MEACIACATTCNHCAISCLEEKEVQHLTKGIRLDLECAAIFKAAAELMSVESSYSKEICQLCATICNAYETVAKEAHQEMTNQDKAEKKDEALLRMQVLAGGRHVGKADLSWPVI